MSRPHIVPFLGGILSACAMLSSVACSSKPTTSGLPEGSTQYWEERFVQSGPPEFDFVFVVDNSPSMRDKLPQLARYLRGEMEALLVPDCWGQRDDSGRPSIVGQSEDGSCREGELSAEPLELVRIAILTGSLGSHGVGLCAEENSSRHFDDGAHLVASVRRDAPDPDGRAFLTYVDSERSDVRAFLDDFEKQLLAVGTRGCPIQQPLEALRRFLVDPAPPLAVEARADGSTDFARDDRGSVLVDEVLLEQRRSFLRPESYVVVSVVTDDDDQSVRSGEAGRRDARWGGAFFDPDFEFPAPSSQCAENPNDACCFSCLDSTRLPPGCSFAHCAAPAVVDPDPLVLRGWESKRRFGIELLHDPSRYVDMLIRPELTDPRTGEEFPNPLLVSEEGRYRSRSVFFRGLWGIPWQTLFTPETVTDPVRGEYLRADQLDAPLFRGADRLWDRWDVVLGEPGLPREDPRCRQSSEEPRSLPATCEAKPQPPLDPFSVGSIEPRLVGAVHPITGDPIVGPDGLGALNGRESTGRGSSAQRLQPSCAVALEEPLPACDASDLGCLCFDSEVTRAAECMSLFDPTPTKTQRRLTARPAPRLAEVARDLGSSVLLGSICDAAAPQARARLFEDLQRGRRDTEAFCVPPLPRDEGRVDCLVAQSFAPVPAVSDQPAVSECESLGMKAPTPEQRGLLERRLQDTGSCGDETVRPCADFVHCIVPELEGQEEEMCLFSELRGQELPFSGFCSVDGEQAQGHFEESAVWDSWCHQRNSARVRLTGEAAVVRERITLIACQETQLRSSP